MKAAGTLALCGALLLGASSPALAAKDPKAQLKIVDAAKGGATKTAWLHCGPVGGTHPRAKEACRLLSKVDGVPSRLNVTPNASCTQEVAPHAVAVVGRWYGKTVNWGKVFANSCMMRAAAGAVIAL